MTVGANRDIRSDLHRIADSLALRSNPTTLRDGSGVARPVDAVRNALLARYHEGYVLGLHDMAEAVIGYLNSQATPADAGLDESFGPAEDFGSGPMGEPQ
jgi:hypothetical protein